MWVRLVRIVLIIAVVDARKLTKSDAVDADRSASSGSSEAEIFVSHDNNGKAVVSKKYLDPPPGKNVYMVKRVNSKPIVATEPLVGVTSSSWSKILNQLGDVHEVASSEEEEQLMSPLDIRVRESHEEVLGKVDSEQRTAKSPSDPMVIAQKLFPVLLRRAMENAVQNISQHTRNGLKDELSKTKRNSETNHELEKIMNRLLGNSQPSVVGTHKGEIDRSLKRRRSYLDKQFYYNNNIPPYVVNIFNNSHIGYLVVKPDCNDTVDSMKNCFGPSSVMYGHIPQSLNFTFALPNSNIPCVHQCSCGSLSMDSVSSCDQCQDVQQKPCVASFEKASTSITSTTPLTATVITTTTTPCPLETATQFQSPCDPATTPCGHPEVTTTYYPAPFYHPMPIHSIPECQIQPWHKFHQKEFFPRQQFFVSRPKYGERVFCDPCKQFAYAPQSDECDCSHEDDYQSENRHVKREPQEAPRTSKRKPQYHMQSTTTVTPLQPRSLTHSEEAVRLIIDLPPAFNSEEIRGDTHLRNTLAKIGLSLDTERPPLAKPVGKSRYRTLAPTRSHRIQQNKQKNRETTEKSQTKAPRATIAPAMLLF
ncbi:uncharacterized protein LOC134223636 [Armigeres subalbatus]|uniref:uncharacterized protein LOC134223636 n=1 Tax=Armigeres subalbatus TaxID=124917 RepID=UPI002ED353C8